MKHKYTFFIMLSMCFFSIALARWPSFFIPTGNQLISQQIFDTRFCRPGYGQFRKGTGIECNLFTNSFCPDNWKWIIKNDTPCISLTDFEYLHHNTEYLRGDNNMIAKTIITASYGRDGVPLVKLQFTTPSEYWLCQSVNTKPPNIICANDT